MNRTIKLSPTIMDWIIKTSEEEKISIEELIIKSVSIYTKLNDVERSDICLKHILNEFKKM